MQNAVFTLTGSIDHIKPDCSVSSSGALEIKTRINHNPSGYWWGLYQTDFKVVYYDGIKSLTLNSSFPPHVSSKEGYFYHAYTLALPTGNVSLEIPNTATTFPLATAAKFITMLPASNYATPSLSLSGTTTTVDNKVTLRGAPITSQAYSSRWLNPSNAVIATTDEVTLHNPVSGVYTYELTLASGCILTKTITI